MLVFAPRCAGHRLCAFPPEPLQPVCTRVEVFRSDPSHLITALLLCCLERLLCGVPLQVITCADFHPMHCSLFAYSSSKGCIRLGDLRSAALCDRSAKTYQEKAPEVSAVEGRLRHDAGWANTRRLVLMHHHRLFQQPVLWQSITSARQSPRQSTSHHWSKRTQQYHLCIDFNCTTAGWPLLLL